MVCVRLRDRQVRAAALVRLCVRASRRLLFLWLVSMIEECNRYFYRIGYTDRSVARIFFVIRTWRFARTGVSLGGIDNFVFHLFFLCDYHTW